jgi:ABC-type methionine transport system ATPase subunit
MKEPIAGAAREVSLVLRMLDIRAGERPLIGELSRGQRDGVASDVRLLLLSPCVLAADRAVVSLKAQTGEEGFDDDVYL